MRDVMAGHVEGGEVSGLVTLVSRRGEVRVEAIGVTALGGRDRMRRDTIFRIASMTKPVAAAAAMILVEECRLRLDDPVDRWLPELSGRTVLKRIDGPLDDTVPAHRPLTLRDLLTLRMGLGYVMVWSTATSTPTAGASACPWSPGGTRWRDPSASSVGTAAWARPGGRIRARTWSRS